MYQVSLFINHTTVCERSEMSCHQHPRIQAVPYEEWVKMPSSQCAGQINSS